MVIQLKLKNIINKCVFNFCFILNLNLLLNIFSYGISLGIRWSRRSGLIYFNLPRNCLSHLHKTQTFVLHVYQFKWYFKSIERTSLRNYNNLKKKYRSNFILLEVIRKFFFTSNLFNDIKINIISVDWHVAKTKNGKKNTFNKFKN